MALHPVKEDALLEWINSLDLDEPVNSISDLHDGCVLLKLVYKLKGEELSQRPEDLPQTERLSVIADYLHSVCDGEQCVLPSGHGTSDSKKLELAKVALLLCYCGLVNRLVPKVEFKSELQMASMFRFVQHGVNSFYLRESVDEFLTTNSLIQVSSSSSVSSYSNDGSPFFTRSRSPLIPFQELHTVASSSFSSPIQEIMNTPQVQLRRLRQEMSREGEIRDELERELAERMTVISEKESQITQLQFRLQRLLRDQEELEKDHRSTLLELQQKNEGLLKRLHEVLEQCQDLKKDNNQKDRRIDELLEENGTLATEVRNVFARLTRAEEEVSKLMEVYQSSQAEWGSRKDSLQKELSQAINDRESLNEQILILQGKVSVLEDELSRVSIQLQEKGENLGLVMEKEKLNQDLADLTLKLSQLEETISGLEKEKKDVEMLLLEARSSFERETLRLQGLISDLQQSLNTVRAEREAQEQLSREKQELLTAQIATLETDLAHIQQLELQLTAEITVNAELCKQREELEAKVASLENTVNMLQAKCQGMEVESGAQQEALNVLRADLQSAQASLMEYEEKLMDHQRVVEENASLHARISALDGTVALLQNEIDAEKKKCEEVLAAKEQQKALLEEKFQQQEEKAHEMFAELETLSQELRKMRQQKLHAESCIEKLTQEGNALAASLTEEREKAQSQLELVKKAKDETEVELQRIITEHQDKISQLQCEIERAVVSLRQRESELFVLKEKISSKDEELLEQQQKLSSLQNESNMLQKQLLEEALNSQQLSEDMTTKDLEVQRLSRELDLKEGEIQSLKVSIQSIETESAEIHDHLQREVEEQRFAVSDLKLQLVEAERLISEKDKALEDLVQQLKDLTEELSSEKERTATSENIIKASKEEHEIKEQTLKLEVAQLRHEIDGHLKSLDELLTEIKSLKEEICQQQDRALQVEQENSVLKTEHAVLEENFAQLQNKLVETTALAAERQSELLALQKEAEHQENLRAKAQEIKEAQQKELEREVTELQAQVNELTCLASERESVLASLHENLKEQEDLKQKHLQESEEALQRQLEKAAELQGHLDSVMHQVAAKNELLESTEKKLKQMELLCQQKETLASEACQAKETLEKTVTKLSTKLKQELDRYQHEQGTLQKDKEQLTSENHSLQKDCQRLQTENKNKQEAFDVLKAELQKDLEMLKNEREHLSSVNHSLLSECQSLQTEKKKQEKTLNMLKADLQKTQDGYQQEVDALQKEKEHISSVNQSLQNEYSSLQMKIKEQQEALCVLRADQQSSQVAHQHQLDTLNKEKEHLSTMNQSLQNECQSLQAEVKGQQETLNTLKADFQSTQEGYQKELETLNKEKEDLISVNQSLQSECQILHADIKEEQEALNTLKAVLQNTQAGNQQELEALKKEKEHLSLVNQSLQSECQNLRDENKGLQNNQDGYQKDLETLNKEKEHLSTVNKSLQIECQSLQAEIKGQQESLNTLKADFQGTQHEYQKELGTLNKEKEDLISVNQSLQSECKNLHSENKEQQETLNTLTADLQKTQESYQKEVEALQKEKEHLSSLNQSLLNEGQSLQTAIKEHQEALCVLKSDVQDIHDGYKKDLEILKKEKESLSSVNQTLQSKCQNFLLVNSEQQEAIKTLRADLQNTQDGSHQELKSLKEENEHLLSVNQSLQSECQGVRAENRELRNTQEGYQRDLETMQEEKEHLSSVSLALQRECDASQRLGAELELRLREQNESIHALKETVQQKERQNQELQEQLKLKIEAVEHYKGQMETAKTHYNGKKQLLVEEQKTRQALQVSLETSESERKALKAELKLASIELEKTRESEKRLMVKVRSLETQLDFVDRQLREKKQAGEVKHKDNVYLRVPAELQNTSTDSLELDLDDSLNAAGKPSAPGESSTPLVRSSERLAAKRRVQDGGSLETLYFTPMNPRGKNRDGTTHQNKLESSITSLGELTLDSSKKPTSSVKRRRTTQVINITMTKKTPSGGSHEAEESFYSLHTTQSHPNLASHKTRPVSMEMFKEPSVADSSDKLLGLPGYRRSNVHGSVPTRATSTFCVGAEYEPEHVADDWMRIAELQSRNKACLPHLKSSYPLESRPSLGFSVLPVTDEDVRFGDPEETIRRASMVPGQLMDSLSSHGLSLAPPPLSRDHASSQPQRYSMLPGQISAGTAAHRSSKQLHRGTGKTHDVRTACSPLATKRPAGQLQDQDTPEAKKLASCFPRPATPKSRGLRSTSNSQNRPPSPAERRQSMAFVIENTPKKSGKVDSRLQRGFNKLRNSARKSPASARLSRPTTAGRSPLVDRAQRKSPRTASTKSPKIPNSARKMFKMKV